MAYVFKDTDLATRRLHVLTEVFEPASRAFLRDMAAGERHALALDLGCGPGYTTRLVAEVTGCEQAFGMDASERFVARASTENASEHISFVRHDLTQIPFP